MPTEVSMSDNGKVEKDMARAHRAGKMAASTLATSLKISSMVLAN